MINLFFITLFLQSSAAPPRISLQNPAIAYPVPAKVRKDYDKLWQRFAKGKEDEKVLSDADKLLKKNSDVVSLMILEAYIDWYAKRNAAAESKFEQILKASPGNRIALSYLSDAAFNRQDYRRAYDLYSKLLSADPSRTDVEPKLQKSLLLATQDLIVKASAAEEAKRLDDAEALYGQALQLAPSEPSLHEKLGELYSRQKKPEKSLEEFRKAKELGGSSDDMDRHIAEELVNLGRTEEARAILDRLKKSGASDGALEAKLNDLEDIGRWGNDLFVFRYIQAAPSLTRSQLAVLLVRYFPQLTEGRKPSVIITDAQNSSSLAEIQSVVGNGLLDLRPNRTFQPDAPVTRAEFASALVRTIRRLGISASTAAPPVPITDVAKSNARYNEIQQALAYGLTALDDTGNFNSNGTVSGEEAVHAVGRALEMSHR